MLGGGYMRAAQAVGLTHGDVLIYLIYVDTTIYGAWYKAAYLHFVIVLILERERERENEDRAYITAGIG